MDDFYAEFRRVSVIVERVAVLETALANVAEDAATVRKNLHALRNDLASAAAVQAADRKGDRRFLVTTCLTCAGLIIAALGILSGWSF